MKQFTENGLSKYTFAAAPINDAMPHSMSELEGGGGERRRKTLTRVCTHFTTACSSEGGRERGRGRIAHAHTWMDLVSAKGKCETCADADGGRARTEWEREGEAVFSRPSPTPTYSALIEISNGIARLYLYVWTLGYLNKRMNAINA